MVTGGKRERRREDRREEEQQQHHLPHPPPLPTTTHPAPPCPTSTRFSHPIKQESEAEFIRRSPQTEAHSTFLRRNSRPRPRPKGTALDSREENARIKDPNEQGAVLMMRPAATVSAKQSNISRFPSKKKKT